METVEYTWKDNDFTEVEIVSTDNSLALVTSIKLQNVGIGEDWYFPMGALANYAKSIKSPGESDILPRIGKGDTLRKFCPTTKEYGPIPAVIKSKGKAVT